MAWQSEQLTASSPPPVIIACASNGAPSAFRGLNPRWSVADSGDSVGSSRRQQAQALSTAMSHLFEQGHPIGPVSAAVEQYAAAAGRP
jgi:hypothetical protein